MVFAPHYATDYIKMRRDCLPQSRCAQIIDRFEASPEIQQVRATPGYSFTEVNVSDWWPDLQSDLGTLFHGAAMTYAAEIGMSEHWPQPPAYEKIRMKRYLPGGQDSFPLHLDVGDYASARRFLVMFLYLNDVAVGGETAFPQWKLAHRPQAGTLLAFPPFYPFLHEGRPPVSGPKYILGCYAHYR